MRDSPRRVVVSFNGIPHEMDMSVARLALVRQQVRGEFHTMDLLAKAVGRSRSTVSRWFTGRQTSLPVALTILDKLNLEFDDVYRRSDVEVEPRT